MSGIDAKTVGEVSRELKEKLSESKFTSGANYDKVFESLICLPSCDVCHGAGYYRKDVPVGHPDFGRLVRCPNVVIARLDGWEKYGLYRDEIDYLSWNTVLPIDGSGATYAVKIVENVVSRGWGWVFLWGDHGQAKSLILKIAVAEMLRKNVEAGYSNMAEILSYLRAAFDSENPNVDAERRLDFFGRLPVLSIDEFDRINNTSWASERRFLLMDQRYNAALRREGVTLIASNSSPSQLDSYFRDRIEDGRFQVIELRGTSARLGMSDDDLF